MTHLKKLAATACVAFGLSATTAAAVDVDFTGGGFFPTDLGNPVSCGVFLPGCTDFTVEAEAGGSLNNGPASVSQSDFGLGVIGSPDLEPGQVDSSPSGSDAFEALTFNFVRPFTLTSISLQRFNTLLDIDDEYTIFIDELPQATGVTNPSPSGSIPGNNSFSISALNDNSNDDPFITVFGPFVIEVPRFDDFTVASISYDIAPIPLPAAGWLLLAGIGGLAAARRRKAS